MVWHILRKDFRLLWPLSLAVVLLGALSGLRIPVDGHFFGSILEQLTSFLPRLVELGIAIVAVTVVHQDALSESQDDWLVRPLLRRDVALAKVLFVLLTVNVPLLIIDVLVQLALHFPLSVSVGVAASRALLLVFLVSLPALMVGAVTRSLANAFMFGIASAIGFVFLIVVAATTLSLGVLGLDGMTWISLWATAGVIAVGSAAALTVQYSTRRTLVARSIGLAAVFAALPMLVLPPGTGTLAIQESLWGPPHSGGIRMRFDPSSQGERSGQEPGPGYRIGTPPSAANAAAYAALFSIVDRQIEKVELPLRISGLHPGDILFADRIDLRLVSMTGRVLYEGAGVCAHEGTGTACSGNRLEVWATSANVPDEEELNLPIRLYQRIKHDPVRVEVSYALTRLVAHPTQMIDAIGGLKALPEMGSCATRVDGDGDEVELGCLTDVGVPPCAGVVLEDPQTNRHNPEVHLCDPQYGPYRRRGLQEAVDRSQLSIPFRDLSGLAHYPVDAAAIARARMDVTVYDPVAHFRTSVTVPNVRLADWAPVKKSAFTAPVRN
ncbi:MAG: ABC transporter permease [Steroidobacteraceae bacterium]